MHASCVGRGCEPTGISESQGHVREWCDSVQVGTACAVVSAVGARCGGIKVPDTGKSEEEVEFWCEAAWT